MRARADRRGARTADLPVGKQDRSRSGLGAARAQAQRPRAGEMAAAALGHHQQVIERRQSRGRRARWASAAPAAALAERDADIDARARGHARGVPRAPADAALFEVAQAAMEQFASNGSTSRPRLAKPRPARPRGYVAASSAAPDDAPADDDYVEALLAQPASHGDPGSRRILGAALRYVQVVVKPRNQHPTEMDTTISIPFTLSLPDLQFGCRPETS